MNNLIQYLSPEQLERVDWHETTEDSIVFVNNGSPIRTPVLDEAPPPAPPTPDVEVPPFPSAALNGSMFAIYQEAYSGRNEICPAYVFASAITQVGAVMGRSVFLDWSPPLYPNVFTMLIGNTSIARKSTTRYFAVEHLNDLPLGEEPALQLLSSVDSAEGITHSLRTQELRRISRNVPSDDGDETSITSVETRDIYEELPQFEGLRALYHLDEIKALFDKRMQVATRGIVSRLTEAYSMPPKLENTSKHFAEVAEYPCVSVLACSTESWLEKSLQLDDIEGGFANRFMFFLHELMPPIATPKPLDAKALGSWQSFLTDLRKHYRGTHQKFTLALHVVHARNAAYAAERQRLVDANPLEAAVSARIEEQTMKLSLLFALADNAHGDTEVKMRHWEAAQQVGRYLLGCNLKLFGLITVDVKAQNEGRILSALERLGNTATRRDIRRHISRTVLSADDFNRSFDALCLDETIVASKDGRKTLYTRPA